MSTADLREKLSKKDENGKDMYSHLENVVAKFLLDDPKNCYEILEDYSYNVKGENYDFKNNETHFDNSQRIRENNSELKESTETAKKLLEKLNDGAEEPQDVGAVGYVPNYMEEARWFEQAGVGFGQEENFRIFKSLTSLSFKKQVKQVRLWGKIMGSSKDYWVAEGIVEGGDDGGELPADVEPKGQKGVNSKNYWVCTDLYSEWVELPIVTPQQIKVARQIKYIFTGDLQREVITNPHFQGQEQHLLKCQIVRISHTTSIQPATLFKVQEEEPREIETNQEEEGFKFPEFESLQKLNNWVHLSENILSEGRLVHMPLEIPEGQEENEEQLKKEQVANDPFEPRLKALSADKAPSGYNSAWTIKSYGDTTNYSIYHKEGTQNHGFIAIKSLVWPGQITLYNKQNWQSLYIGYGFKNSNQLYYPCQPETVMEEVVDGEDYPEPNFPPEQENAEGEEGAENPEGDE